MSAGTPIQLGHVHVRDAMHHGILTTDPSTSLRAVADLMATHRVHAVVVAGDDPRHPWGIVSGLDIAAAAACGREPTAGEAAATEVVTISSEDRLDRAAQVMAEHELTHLIVVDRASGQPIGILSTLDLASAYAG
jgi:CBS domain-containing protein